MPLYLGRIFAVVISLFLLLLLFKDGLGGEFILDDFNSIAFNDDIRISSLSLSGFWQGLSSGQVGILGRPVAMLSFSMDYYFSGYDVAAYKRTSVAVHLINFIVVLGFGVALLKVFAKKGALDNKYVFPLALCSALIWALHPLQVSTVVYVVQRMTMLSAFFVFLALWLYVIWRSNLTQQSLLRILMPVAILLVVALGFLSKENAILLPVYILLIEAFVFGKSSSVLERRYQQLLYIIAGICLACVILYIHVNLNWFEDRYQIRSFTLQERLLTEARVVVGYFSWILLPSVNNFGLFHDYITVSKSLFDPYTTLVSILGLIAMIVLCVKYKNKMPWLGFGLLFFLAGHLLESTIIPLELVFEHRNYLPSYGVVLMFTLGLINIAIRLQMRSIFLSLMIVVVAYLSVLTSIRLREWSDTHLQALSSVERHPDSARSQWQLARWYLSTYSSDKSRGYDDLPRLEQGVKHAEKAYMVNKAFTTSLFGLIGAYSELNLPLKKKWVDELSHRIQMYPYSHENDTSFKIMITCALADNAVCNIEHKVVERLFNAVFSNGYLTKRQKANLSQGYGIYLHEKGYKEKSFNYLREAEKHISSKSLYQNLVGVCIELKRKNDAEYYMNKLKQMLKDSEKNENIIKQLEAYVDTCCDQDLSIKMRF